MVLRVNEIVVSTTGLDREFLEIWGTPGTDLTGKSILEIASGGEISDVIDLTGSVGLNGYFLLTSPEAEDVLGVVGNQQIADDTFNNSSRTYLLVDGFTGGAGDDIDLDDDGTVDGSHWSSLIDGVAVVEDDDPLVYSGNVLGPDGSFLAPGGYRDPDGSGDFVQHDFSDTSQYTPNAAAGVVINEIVVSTSGTDAEFLELYGAPGEDLGSYSLLEIEPGGEIDVVTDLTGSVGDNGYFLLASPEAEARFGVTGNQAIANDTLTNGSRTYLLVKDFTGSSGDDIDADDDGVIDNAPWAAIADSVAPVEGDSPLIYSANVVGPDGSFLAPGAYRDPEGTGGFEIHEFGDFSGYTPTKGTGDTGGGDPEEPVELVISQIQGSGDTSSREGQLVTVEAIVVGDFQNGDGDDLRNLGGFFIQEEAADQDGDAATSEGLFIFDGALAVDVQLGDRVQIAGTVSEFQGQTQISALSVTVVEQGAVADINDLAVSVSLDDIDDVIVDGTGNYAPDLKAYEGMLATFTDTLTVNEMFQLDRFNEIRLSADGRPEQFTQFAEPDAAAFNAYQREVRSDGIIFDDGLNEQNAPILPEADLDGDGDFDTADGFTMGDTITGLTGIVNYTWAGNSASGNSWRVRSVDDGNEFENTSTRDETPPDVGGSLTVASFNVLNFFTTLNVDGNPGSGPNGIEPRGADNIEEFERQLDKLLTTLTEMDADIYGLVEIENEFGFDQNGDGVFAAQFLVDELNARIGSVTYAAVDIGRGFVDVGDAISVGMIYNVNSVGLVEGSVNILDDGVVATLPSSYPAPLFDGEDTNRAPLAATFEDLGSGEEFTVAVTHMKSKGGSGTGGDADADDGAGAFNETRTEGVRALTEWLDTFADEDRLVLGDFNAYAQEDPIDVMRAAEYDYLAADTEGSYVFDGYTGTLDYAFGSQGLLDNVTGAGHWTINSDEPDAIDYNTDFGRDPEIFDGSVPFRSSDHDPVLVGLDFGPALNLVQGTTGRDTLLGSGDDDLVVFEGGFGDIGIGRGGDDQFDFAANVANGTVDSTRIADWSAGDLILGFDADDVNLSSVRETDSVLRFAYGPDNDVLTITGDVSGGLESLFGAEIA